jgi:hypothetical protein
VVKNSLTKKNKGFYCGKYLIQFILMKGTHIEQFKAKREIAAQ